MTPCRALAEVAAAIIVQDGRYLVAKRPPDKSHGGKWEFPGGKQEPGEDLTAAIARELSEELRLEVLHTGALLGTVEDLTVGVVVNFLEVEVKGVPNAIEHQCVDWFTLTDLTDLPLAPADREFVLALLKH